jgi:protein involved in polysaccharide export with SLBB domain
MTMIRASSRSHARFTPRAALRHFAVVLSALTALSALCLAVPAQAQIPGVSLPLSAAPAVTPPPMAQPATPSPAAAAAAQQANQPVATGQGISSLPLPPDPATSPTPVVFGSQIFSGRFGAMSYSGFNADYQIAVGDRLLLRLWGAVAYEAYQTVDPQGNIFVPNVGPVTVQGLRNADLNKQVSEQVRKIFKANVGVYATLDSAQPVKVFVTGYVRAPGLYPGLSSDAVLSYLDRAGGIDPDRGSYVSVQVKRGSQVRATYNLYDFLLKGKLDTVQLQDGDTIVVGSRQFGVAVSGEVQNPYLFEINKASMPASELLAMAVPKASATHVSVVRNTGVELKSEYYPLGEVGKVTINSGDQVTVTSDKYPTTLLIRVNGAQRGERSIIMPAGSRLKDVVARLSPSPSANMAGLQLFRKSVQARQKQTLDIALQNLATSALTARSATSEEAGLRKAEADMMLTFIARAGSVMPLGQVVLTGQSSELLLEDGDVLNIPESKNLVLISGEVIFPNALIYNPEASIDDYVNLAGGYTQKADTSKILVMRADGSVAPTGTLPAAGDEVMVLPKIDSKNIEVTRGITQILYQIAVAAKLALGL